MTGPIFVTLGSWLLFNEQISRGFLFGLIISLAGAAPLVATSVGAQRGTPAGRRHRDVGRRLLRRLSPGDQAAARRPADGHDHVPDLSLQPAGPVRGGLAIGRTAGATDSPRLAASSLALALSAQAFGQALIALAMSRLPAPFTSVSLLVQPFLAILLGWLILGEAATALQFLGGFVVLVGILISRRYGMRRPTPERS